MKKTGISRTKQLSFHPHWSSTTLFSAVFASLLLLSGGCQNQASTSGTPSGNSQAGTAQPTANNASASIPTVVAADFADNVVIPTYQRLVQQAENLSQSINAFVENPTDETLKAAQEAWINTRVPWEQSEAFAFGPAESLGYDGDLDDWPVNETDVVAVINTNEELTPESVKGLQTTQKGFHTIEYLLFGLNADKTAADFSKRELEFLKVTTVAFNESANNLVKSWVEGVNGNPPYREVLATAGQPNNPAYPTPQTAVEEIVQGMLGCLDEVANAKIGEPLETKESLTFESRFSQSSLNDFKNNLLSVQNAYTGQVPEVGKAGKSISDLVAQKNPQLDQQVKKELQAAIDAVNSMPNPIEPNVTNSEAAEKMKNAQTAILTAFSTIQEQVLPIVKQ